MRETWLLILLLAVCGCAPAHIPSAPEAIDLHQEPYRQFFSGNQTFTITNDYGLFVLVPRTFFRMAAVVISCKRYHSGWEAALSPLDMAMAWGKMSRSDVIDSLNFIHEKRGYRYQISALPGFDANYASEHITNAHVIPASTAIRRALRKIKSRDRVLLEGFLVDVFGKSANNEYVWKTGLSSTAQGMGSCPLLYLQRIQINETVVD